MKVRRFGTVTIGLVGFSVLLLAPMDARAVPEFSVLASASTVAGGTSDSQNTGVLVNTPSASVSALSSSASEIAMSSAFASPGTLGAFATGSSGSASLGGATAHATAAFTDVLTLSGPATLGFSLDVGGFLDACSACPAQGQVSASFSVSGSGSFVNNVSSVGYERHFLGGIGDVTPIPLLPIIVLTTTMAEEISLSGNISVFIGVDGVGSFATADYSSTAKFFADVLTPGATYVSASGVNYASTVPEPSTLGLALLGLSALWWVVRIKSSA